jgi:acetyl esterase/lipase
MDVQVEKDLVFAAHDRSDLTLDIYGPPHDDAPVAIYVHSGGWRSGDKADDGARRLTPLSACGVTVVAVSYRFVPCAVPRPIA